MSASVDERIVSMRFDNKQFEAGVKTSLNTLESLKKSADNLSVASKGISDFAKSANGMDLSGISSSIQALQDRFSTLGIVGMRIVENLTDKVMEFSGKLMSKISSGGWTRAMNIENAKFQLAGLGVAWEDIEDDINYGVKDTAYGLDSAAKAASQLVASQVQLGDEMKTALRGISGVAAMTNSEYDEIAHIFTRVAGQGKVMAVDLNSLAGKGLNAAATIADYLGVTEKEVREMVSESKISFDIFATAMDSAFGQHAKDANKTFTGAMSNISAALSRIGAKFATPIIQNLIQPFNDLIDFIDTANKAIDPIAKDFTAAVERMSSRASKILTNSNLLDALSTIIRSVYNVGQGIYNIVYPIIYAFKNVFPPKTAEDILAISQRIEKLTIGFKNLFDPVKKSGESLEEFQKRVARIKNLRATFEGLFSVFSIGGQIISAVARSLAPLIKRIFGLGDGLLDVTGSFGQFLKNLSDMTKKNDTFYNSIQKVISKIKEWGTTIKEFVSDAGSNLVKKFEEITGIDIKMPSLDSFKKFFEDLKNTLKTAFTGGSGGDVKNNILDFFSNLKDKMTGFNKTGEETSGILKKITDWFGNLNKKGEETEGIFDKLIAKFTGGGEAIESGGLDISSKIGEIFDGIKEKISEFISNTSFSDVIKYLNKVLLSGILLSITGYINSFKKNNTSFANLITGFKKTLENGFKFKFDFKFGALDNVFNALTNNLKTMQQGVKAEIIKQIAISIAILAASLFVLSLVNPANLAAALGAVSTLFLELMKSMKMMVGSSENFFSVNEMGALSTTIIKMSAAILIMSSAIKKLTKADPVSLAAATAAIIILMEEMARLAKKLSALDLAGNLGSAGTMMILFAASISILSSAVKKLSKIDPASLAFGLGAVVILMEALVGMMWQLSKIDLNAGEFLAIGASLILIAAALNLMTIPLIALSLLKPEKLVLSVVSLISLLGVIAGFQYAVDDPKHFAAIAASLILVSASFVLMAGALGVLSLAKPENLLAGMAVLAGSLLAIAMFDGSIKDPKKFAAIAASLLLVGASLMLISGALAIVSLANPEGLINGFVAIAGLLAAIAVFEKNIQDTKKFAAIAGSMIIISAAISLLGSALKKIGDSNPESLAVGFLAIAGLLAAIALFARAIDDPKKFSSITNSISVLAFSLSYFSKALASLAVLDPMGLGMAMVSLGGAFISLAAGLALIEKANVSKGTIAAVSLLVMVMPKLAKALETLSNIEHPIQAILLLVGALAALGLTAALLTPIGPILLVVAGAMLMLGTAVALVGTGLSAVVGALILLAGLGAGQMTQAIENLKTLALTLIGLIPSIIEAMAVGFVQGMTAILEAAKELIPLFAETVTLYVTTVCETIIELAPLIGETIKTVLLTLIDLMVDVVPELVDGLIVILDATLASLAEHSESIAESIAETMMGFLTGAINGVADRVDELIDACWNFIISLVDGIANGLDEHAEELRDAFVHLFESAWDALLTFFGIHSPSEKGSDMGNNIILGVLEGLSLNIDDIRQKIKEGIQKGLDAIKEKLISFKNKGKDIVTNIKDGVDSLLASAKAKLRTLMTDMSDAASEKLSLFLDRGKDIVTKVKDGIENLSKSAKEKIQGLMTDMSDTADKKTDGFFDVGKHAVEGIINGIEELASKAIKTMKNLAQDMIDKAKEKFDENSPSKVFEEIGKFVVLGLVEGVDGTAREAILATEEMAESVIDIMQSAVGDILDAVSGEIDMDPVITPVIDLTDVKTKASMISGMLSPEVSAIAAQMTNSSIGRMSTAEQQDTTTPESNQTTYSFTQNNYSPKALSRIDIYRNTRNQILQIKEVARA